MNRSQPIQKELSNISFIVAELSHKPVFSVPAGYFESLPEKITGRIKKEEAGFSVTPEIENLSPLLTSLKNKYIPETPAGYFDSFPEKIINRIKEEEPFLPAIDEINSLSPLLAALKNKTTFKAPAGYFNNLPEIVADFTNADQAPVISIRKKNLWAKYAVAAVIAGIIAMSSFLLWNNNNKIINVASVNIQQDQSTGITFPEISDDALSGYLSTTLETGDAIMDTTYAELYDIAFTKADDAGFVTMLKDVSDEDLTNYEQETLTKNRTSL